MKERCESPDCIAVASVALSFDSVSAGGEFFFCEACFEQIEGRLSLVSERRTQLIAGGVHELMANRIVSEETKRREI